MIRVILDHPDPDHPKGMHPYLLWNFFQSKKTSEIVESGDDADKEDEEDEVEEEEEVSG